MRQMSHENETETVVSQTVKAVSFNAISSEFDSEILAWTSVQKRRILRHLFQKVSQGLVIFDLGENFEDNSEAVHFTEIN